MYCVQKVPAGLTQFAKGADEGHGGGRGREGNRIQLNVGVESSRGDHVVI